jgi:periplasmic protein TonB
MFERALLLNEAHNRRTCGTLLGFLTQSVLVTAAVMVPMLYPDTLPRMQNVVSIFTPGPPPPPPAPPSGSSAPVRRAIPLRAAVLTEPTSMPAVAIAIDEPPLTAGELGSGNGVPGGVQGGVEGGVVGAIPTQAPAPPPPVETRQAPAKAAPAAPPTTPRIRVGGVVQDAMVIDRPIPVYPTLARQMRISGVVELVGVIGRDGRIQELKVVRGHPLLVKSALEAVARWVYRPTLLNGDPVEVVAPITVEFHLN